MLLLIKNSALARIMKKNVHKLLYFRDNCWTFSGESLHFTDRGIGTLERPEYCAVNISVLWRGNKILTSKRPYQNRPRESSRRISFISIFLFFAALRWLNNSHTYALAFYAPRKYSPWQMMAEWDELPLIHPSQWPVKTKILFFFCVGGCEGIF